MVDGDLDVNGGFSWYGVVLVRGTVKYTGGGGKNVTGGVVSGDSMMNLTDPSVTGGGTNIVYCSSAVNNLTQNSPLRRLSWRENDVSPVRGGYCLPHHPSGNFPLFFSFTSSVSLSC